jgi:hypothetical protein
MRSIPSLDFTRNRQPLSWEGHTDDVCFMTEEVEGMILNFAHKFEVIFPDSECQISSRKINEWESERYGVKAGAFITDFLITLKFNSDEDEAQFILLKSCGEI